MARKRKSTTESSSAKITTERASRLYRLVQFLGSGQTRAQILRKLQIDIRAFYRDLEMLRTQGIVVTLEKGKYRLNVTTEEALLNLPFPDPQLTVGEVQQLSKGKSAAHRKVKSQLDQILPS